MRFQLQPNARPPESAPAPHPSPAASVTPAPSLRIGRLEIEGCGPISPASLREGFHAAWMTVGKHAPGTWTAVSPDAFHAPLALDVPHGLGGRELGRRLAEAILTRARAAATTRRP